MEGESLLQLLDAQIAKLVGRPFFTVMLDGDDSTGIHVIFDVGGNHAIDLDLELLPLQVMR
jgi:hypothetical protein